MDESRVQELQESHERLIKNPNIMMLGSGPLDLPDVSKEFVNKLADLTPTQRRHALAKACIQPWRDDPAGMPACYQRDFDHARYELAHEQLVISGPTFEPDELFDPEPEPISRTLLGQLAGMSGTDRRSSLVFVISCCWSGQAPEAWRDPIEAGLIEWPDTDEPPEWICREFDLWCGEASEEFRRRNGTNRQVTAEQGARELEVALNWVPTEGEAV